MKVTGNNILITGGGTGIGYALAERFAKLGNKVLVCGRRQDKLDEAKAKIPNLITKKCDIANAGQVGELLGFANASLGGINVLVNNAGIQHSIDFRKGAEDFADGEEIDVNFKAQVRLAALVLPSLMGKENSAILNVSSGLAFVPIARFPIYCATKAAMHSFTQSLRQQLAQARVKVFEIIPPTVHDTELKGKPMEKTDYSVSSAEMADAVIRGLEADEYEIAAGPAKRWLAASKSELDQAFKSINSQGTGGR